MPKELPDHFLQCEAQIKAFSTLNATGHSNPSGCLSGLRVGVKDIIDVVGLPTQNGSLTCKDVAPALADATTVSSLRSAGASIVGKTTTTEFAFTDPTPCRNPHDLKRSPGGSSSGSGAAVAARMVDAALGTQTAGSLCRPAAYCGVVGFKPTYGVLPMTGVTPLAPSFDCVGIIARSVNIAHRCFEVMRTDRAPKQHLRHKRTLEECVVMGTLLDTSVAPSVKMQTAYEAACLAMSRIAKNASHTRINVDTQSIISNHRMVMNFEAAQAHGQLLSREVIDLLQPKFRAALQAGARITKQQMQQASHELAQDAKAFWQNCEGIDIIVSLPVPEGAPLMDGTTGFQDWLTPWTVFGGPLLTLPWGADDLGRPCAVMLAGRPHHDMMVLEIASALEACAPPAPVPVLRFNPSV